MFLDQRTAQVKRLIDLRPFGGCRCGCGSGEIIDWMAARSKFVHGIDISEAMIETARTNVHSPCVELRVSDCADPLRGRQCRSRRVPSACWTICSTRRNSAGVARITRAPADSCWSRRRRIESFMFLRWSTAFRRGVSGIPPIVSILGGADGKTAQDSGSNRFGWLDLTTMWLAVAHKPA